MHLMLVSVFIIFAEKYQYFLLKEISLKGVFIGFHAFWEDTVHCTLQYISSSCDKHNSENASVESEDANELLHQTSSKKAKKKG